ncbi:PssD/Cps14F family polysaccharide biosynthesis glycosyltransferase [Enorma massiliensis]|uniref:UDP-N-acetylglucosamine--LPS N-acetylglucosamine transferase n=1 Tax=Enorma massiliensis TaxID=1472761 RepID=A0A1Y3U1K1_9ACTN|nr:PssD/Cps14F family polysaccharide biosynthesis glycosyltransferase [Enorma massiliensis]OUN42606.1 UDP-N-acetylglucosamine--LPS N-acetylglucosamine transferase [Enorma massiliensis]
MDLSRAKVCIPTSSGGHLTHMRMLMPVLEKARDRFWVTFDKEDANTALEGERVYHCYFPTNRNVRNTVRNTLLAIRVLRREHPDLIVSSGAAIAVPFFVVGKLLGAKTVYIEVFDRVDAPTLTGRLVRRLTDLFVVQWPEMTHVYPGSVDLGSIF